MPLCGPECTPLERREMLFQSYGEVYNAHFSSECRVGLNHSFLNKKKVKSWILIIFFLEFFKYKLAKS